MANRSRLRDLMAIMVVATGVFAADARADSIYKGGDWPNLAADRVARHVGDSLTVTVSQSSVASNSSRTDSQRATHLGGEVASGSHADAGRVAFDGGTSGAGLTQRSDRLVAQVSVVVTEVLPNGDLRVEGEQVLRIDGRRTVIRIQGRVRQSDVGSDNSIESSRMADAKIDYDGTGLTGRKGASAIVTRLFNALGLH